MSHRLDGYLSPQTSNGVNGLPTVISSQSATGTTAAGGDITIQSGTGTSHDGYITLMTGNTSKLAINNAFTAITAPALVMVTPLAIFEGTQVNPAIFQISQPSAGVDGNILTIQSQSSTTSPAHGGNLVLATGDGYNGDGYVRDGYIRMLTGSSRNVLTLETYNASFFVANGSLGGGKGVIFVANATTVPTSNPTGGGILYVENGTLKYLGPSGSITTIAPA